jgi:hypothetical protein
VALITPTEDDFEDGYKSKFMLLANRHGVEMNYTRDRAAIDAGLHLKSENVLLDTRVWFQFKGLHTNTLSKEEFESSHFITISGIRLDHVRSWYRSADPVYLVVYIESADVFLAQDVMRLFNDDVLNPDSFEPNQRTISVRMPTSEQVGETFWEQLRQHRSMRLEGRSYRGRPLGHNYNPLSSIILRTTPEVFEEVVEALLHEHNYRVQEEIDVAFLFAGEDPDNRAKLTVGVMHQKYEVVSYLTNELVLGPDDGPGEGKSDMIYGRCAVLIHSQVASQPNYEAVFELARVLKKKKVQHLLVMVNHYQMGIYTGSGEEESMPCRGAYIEPCVKADIEFSVQHLEDLGYSITTATNVWMRYRDKLTQWQDLMRQKEAKGEIRAFAHPD